MKFSFLAIAETKLNSSFPDAQFYIDGYYKLQEFRKDRCYNQGGGMLIYIQSGIPCKRLRKLEPPDIETIIIELSFGKSKWCIISLYRNEDISPEVFLSKLGSILDKLLNDYDNVIIIGDININSLMKNTSKFEQLQMFCESYDLINLVKVPTCFQSINNPSSVDLILTNKKHLFMHTKAVATGLSDHHSLICTMLKSKFSKLKPIKVTYRCFRKFDNDSFINDLQNSFENIDFGAAENELLSISKQFENVANRHAPMKSKIIRGNHAPFVTKQLLKEIRYRSRLKHKYLKEKSIASKIAFKKQRNKCTKIKRESIKAYFKKVADRGQKSFWKTINPFLSNKCSHGQESYILHENGGLIRDPKAIADIFNEYYTNIVEYTTGKPPVIIPVSNSGDIIGEILDYYKDHESLVNIKNRDLNESYEISPANEEQVYKIIMNLNVAKATGIDNIPARLVKLAANILKTPFTNALNASIQLGKFPNHLKIGKISPVYKNSKAGLSQEKEYYRPITVLVVFSKIYERYILEDMLTFVNKILSDNISAYRKGYSCQHVLMNLTDEWRRHLDKNHVVGAVLMDLSKAFDCLPHELLIAKLAAYGVSRQSLKFFYSYLKDRKQRVNIKGQFSEYMEVLAGVPQGSILGPILFNIFINDIVYIFKRCTLSNFADDNSLSAHAVDNREVIESLEVETQKAIAWFKSNHQNANAEKFDAILIEKSGRDTSNTPLKINGKTIYTSKDVSLLGITIDNKLSFKTHIGILCRDAANKLNGIKRLKSYLDITTKRQLAKTFCLCYFNYCPVIWHFCGTGDIHKIERLHERVIRFIYNDYTSNYLELLSSNDEPTMFLKRVREIAQEVYKTLNGMNPKYTELLLHQRTFISRRPLDLYVPRVNQETFGYRSYTFEAPSIWNSLPLNIRKVAHYPLFKKLLKMWTGPSCRCIHCKYNPNPDVIVD